MMRAMVGYAWIGCRPHHKSTGHANPPYSVPVSVLLQVDAVAGIAGHAQLRNLLLEGLLCFGAARFEGDLRRVSGALVEIRKASPNLGRRIGVAARIAIDVGLPLIR